MLGSRQVQNAGPIKKIHPECSGWIQSSENYCYNNYFFR